MDDLAIEEEKKYDAIWLSFPEYREESPADFLTPVFLSYFEREIKPGDRVIDFGCGSGRSVHFLAEAKLDIQLVDISENCLDSDIFLMQLKNQVLFTKSPLWSLPSSLLPGDWLICFDVLEHIPESRIDQVLQGMRDRMGQGGLISIFLEEEVFGKAIGQKLHLTLRPADWWAQKMGAYFEIEKKFPTDDKTFVAAVRKK